MHEVRRIDKTHEEGLVNDAGRMLQDLALPYPGLMPNGRGASRVVIAR